MNIKYIEHTESGRELIEKVSGALNHPLRGDKVIANGWLYDVLSVEHYLCNQMNKNILIKKLCKDDTK